MGFFSRLRKAWPVLPFLLLVVLGALTHFDAFRLRLSPGEVFSFNILSHPGQLAAHIFSFRGLLMRPLSSLVLFLLYKLFGSQPAPYFSLNVLLHIGNALLLYAVAKESGLRRPFLAALLFLVHTLSTGAIVHLYGLPYSLGTFFMLAGLTAYLSMANGKIGARCGSALMVLAYFLMLTSKQVFVFFPVLPWLAPFFTRRPRRFFVEGHVCFALCLGLAVIFLLFYALPNSARTGMDSLHYWLVQFNNWRELAGSFVWPYSIPYICLAGKFDQPGRVVALASVAFSLIALLLILAARNSRSGFYLAAFFIALIPTNSIIPKGQIIVFWRLYPALAFYSLLLISLLPDAVPHRISLGPAKRLHSMLKEAPTAGLCVLCLVLFCFTKRQYSILVDEKAKWLQVAAAYPEDPYPYDQLLRLSLERQDYSAAREYTLKACMLLKQPDCNRIIRKNLKLFMAKVPEAALSVDRHPAKQPARPAG